MGGGAPCVTTGNSKSDELLDRLWTPDLGMRMKDSGCGRREGGLYSTLRPLVVGK